MTMSLAKCDDMPASEMRAETRTHLFLVATLSTEETQTTVRIRNLSASGALIEGSSLPLVGAAVFIRRGSLSAEGLVVWRSENQLGIEFTSSVFVSDWLPKNTKSSQDAVDQIVYDLKNGRGASSARQQLDSAPSHPITFSAELSSLRNDLVSLADKLVQDIVLVATHPEIQTLDIAIQKIDRMMSQKTTSE